MGLNGRVALVTGGSSGIGLGVAKRFAAAGGRVCIAGRDLDAARAAATQIGDEKVALPLAMDVADEERVNAGVDRVVQHFGQIDILVSNAGIQIVHPVEDFPYEDWKKVLSIHLDGAFLTTKACIKYMYPQKSGALIYMGSVHSHEASPMKSAYVAAKHGLLGFTRTVAKEAAKHNVRANIICPGFVRTPLVERQIPKLAKDLGIPEDRVAAQVMLRETVNGAFTTEAEVAEVALMLAAFETNALTGQSITVSHGWHMG